MMRKDCLIAVFLALDSIPASANDTIANFAAGGLTFSRTDAVGIESEDLYLSAAEVRVSYRFHNLTDRGVEGTVAFPLPDIAVTESDASYPDGPPDNPMRFSATVDGRSLPARFEKKATIDGKDVGETLRSFKIPLEPYSEQTSKRLGQLDPAAIAKLKDMKIIDLETYSDGHGQKTTPVPKWSLSGAYYWQQKFPAGRDVVIRHRYRPSLGAAVVDLDGMAGAKNAADIFFNDAKAACADDAFVSAARKWAMRQRQDKHPAGSPREIFIDYVLVTGANWAGPIKTFKLTVDKGKPENLISFCGQDVRKTSATEFQAIRTNYTPDRNIRVLILTSGQ